MLEPDFSDLQFRVEAWNLPDTAIEEILAACTNVLIGKGAFEAAVAMAPHRRILLRHGARVVLRHEPDARK